MLRVHHAIQGHPEAPQLWLNGVYISPNLLIPMQSESKYLHELENAKGPTDDKGKQMLEMKMSFDYRQALGEVLYAMVTCHPDISIDYSSPLMRM